MAKGKGRSLKNLAALLMSTMGYSMPQTAGVMAAGNLAGGLMKAIKRKKRNNKKKKLQVAERRWVDPSFVAGARKRRDKRVIENSVTARSGNKGIYGAAPELEYSAATVKFLHCCIDPWDARSLGAYIPSECEGPSYKTRTVVRLTVTIGTGGTGFVAFAPTLANDVACIASSNSTTYVGTSFDGDNAGGTGWAWTTMSALPFTFAQVSEPTQQKGVSGRIVCFGYKITYAGTEANKGGIYHMIAFPDRGTIAGLGPSTTPTIGSYPIANIRAIDRQPMSDALFGLTSNEVCFSSINETETSLMYYPFGNGADTATDIPLAGGIFISGAASGSIFEVDVIQHSEFVGKGAGSYLTPVSADIAGYQSVRSALMELEYNKAGLPSGNQLPAKLAYVRQSLNDANRAPATIVVNRGERNPGGFYSAVGAGPFG